MKIYKTFSQGNINQYLYVLKTRASRYTDIQALPVRLFSMRMFINIYYGDKK